MILVASHLGAMVAGGLVTIVTLVVAVKRLMQKALGGVR